MNKERKDEKGGGGKKGKGGYKRPDRPAPLTPTEQRRKQAEERLAVWEAKTKLGKMVVSGEIDSLHAALNCGFPLREPEIIDILVPEIKEEVLDIHMVQRMSDSGRRIRFAVTTVVGNEDGAIGLGRASGKLVRPTIGKSIDKAKMNLIEIRRGSGSWESTTNEPNSLPFSVMGRCSSTRVTLKPAPPGVGLVTNQVGRIMLGLAGIKDVWSFSKGQTKTIYNFANAVYTALKKTSTTRVLAGQEEEQNIIRGAKK
tara:strand:+ start:1197 stop:1964 length:768 start_codon:yes stop_codon:yes gene_type:complete